MYKLRPKKSLGQHFLRDANIARKVVKDLLDAIGDSGLPVVEVGAGDGFLTRYLLKAGVRPYTVEIDSRAAVLLRREFPMLGNRILTTDFLKMIFREQPGVPFALVGNFPYNISSQILFKVLENKEIIPVVVGMFQREVAERIVSLPGSKNYGILSVLLGAFYRREYLFPVSENVFYPRPRVKSAVVRLTRNETLQLPCDEERFIRLVKEAFGHRRKMLKNALKDHFPTLAETSFLMKKRAEELSVEDFIRLTLI